MQFKIGPLFIHYLLYEAAHTILVSDEVTRVNLYPSQLVPRLKLVNPS